MYSHTLLTGKYRAALTTTLMALAMIMLASAWRQAAARPKPKSHKSAGSTTLQTDVLTLDQALRIAAKNNLTLRAARKALAAAKINIKAAYTTFGPHLSATTSLTLQGGQSMPFKSGSFDPSSITCPPGHADCLQDATLFGQAMSAYSASMSNIGESFLADQLKQSLTLAWPIFASGRRYAGLKAARTSHKLLGQELDNGKLQVRAMIKMTYYRALQAKALIRVLNQSIAAKQAHLEQAKRLQAAGLRPRGDILIWKVNLAQDEQNLIDLEEKLARTKIALNSQLGRPLRQRLILAKEGIDFPPPPAALSRVENLADRHPRVQAARLRAKLRGVEVNRVTTRWLPSLDLVASYSWTRYMGIAGADDFRGSWLVGINFNWKFFDSLGDYFALRAAKLERGRARLQALEVKRKQEEQIKLAGLKIRSARARINVAAKQLALAGQAHEAVNNRYQAGQATVLDVKDAMVTLTRARALRLSARYDYLVALAELELAKGWGK